MSGPVIRLGPAVGSMGTMPLPRVRIVTETVYGMGEMVDLDPARFYNMIAGDIMRSRLGPRPATRPSMFDVRFRKRGHDYWYRVYPRFARYLAYLDRRTREGWA